MIENRYYARFTTGNLEKLVSDTEEKIIHYERLKVHSINNGLKNLYTSNIRIMSEMVTEINKELTARKNEAIIDAEYSPS